jgi:hypothetical protein
LLHAQRVFLEAGIAVDGTIESPAQLVIHRRRRKDFNLVIHLLDTFDFLDDVFGVALQAGTRNLSEQGYVVAVDLVSQVIENTQVREHTEFVPHFALNALHRTVGWRVLLCERGERCQHHRNCKGQQSEFHWISLF